MNTLTRLFRGVRVGLKEPHVRSMPCGGIYASWDIPCIYTAHQDELFILISFVWFLPWTARENPGNGGGVRGRIGCHLEGLFVSGP